MRNFKNSISYEYKYEYYHDYFYNYILFQIPLAGVRDFFADFKLSVAEIKSRIFLLKSSEHHPSSVHFDFFIGLGFRRRFVARVRRRSSEVVTAMLLKRRFPRFCFFQLHQLNVHLPGGLISRPHGFIRDRLSVQLQFRQHVAIFVSNLLLLLLNLDRFPGDFNLQIFLRFQLGTNGDKNVHLFQRLLPLVHQCVLVDVELVTVRRGEFIVVAHIQVRN